MTDFSPREIVSELDRFIIGQTDAKRAVAIALRNRWRRLQLTGALRVAAFLRRYYGEGGQWGDLRQALPTVTTKDRMALVTVIVRGTPYVIVDIGLRMLKPHELYRAQGFPADYVIERTADGRPISTTAAVRMVGNSVSPPPLRALALANLDPMPVAAAAAA